MARRAIDRVIVHCSATEDGDSLSWPAIRRHHVRENLWRTIGYHVGVERVEEGFEALLGRPIWQAGSHCRGQNQTSLGICFVGVFDVEPPPEGQYVAGALALAPIMAALDLGASRLTPHRQFNRNKTCPGDAFDLAHLQRLVAAEILRYR